MHNLLLASSLAGSFSLFFLEEAASELLEAREVI